MIKLRLITDLAKDYEVIKDFWPRHGWPMLPIGALTTMGMVAEEGDTILAACWIYTATNSSLAMMEWMVTNPDASPLQAAKAVNFLAGFAIEETKRRGYSVLFTTCKNKGLERVYERAGFEKTDEGVTHYVKTLQDVPTIISENEPSRASASE
jgi:hypothetical protein